MSSRFAALASTVLVVFVGWASPPPAGDSTAGLRALDRVQAVVHVAPTGDDANPGTGAQPWRTLAASLSRLDDGDILWVHGGSYEERVNIDANPGRPDARITVAAYPGERPVIVGSLWLAGPSYWTIDGINVTWGATNSPEESMVRLWGGTGWVFANAELWNAHSVAALMIDGRPGHDIGSFVVRGNCIHDTQPSNDVNQDHNIYVDDFGASPAPYGIIERNVLFNAPNGNNIKLGGGDGGGPRNVQVRYNSMYGGNRNVSVSIEASDNRIYRNILGDAHEANIAAYNLTGTGNVAFENIGFGAPIVVAATPGYNKIESDRNVAYNPRLDKISCGGFRPADRDLPFGRGAPAAS